MTNATILDEGPPAPPDLGIEGFEPQELELPEAFIPAARFGNAMQVVFGRQQDDGGPVAGAPEVGTYHRRISGWADPIAVAGNAATAPAGAWSAAYVTNGGLTGPFAFVPQSPTSGQVQIVTNADGTSALTFNAADAVSEVQLYGLLMPPNMLAHLDAAPDPP